MAEISLTAITFVVVWCASGNNAQKNWQATN
jgi:hypothetical protein